MSQPDKIEGQPCPFCNAPNLTLMEEETEIPFFGKVFIFSMSCSACKVHKADIEAVEQHDPARYEIEISGEADMKIRVVKSSQGLVKIPHIGDITPGPASEGYITNVEGILERIKVQIEMLKNDTDADNTVRKRAKKLLNKIQDVMWGHDKLKLIIEDPTGNSAIISEKATKSPLKKKRG